MKKFLVCEWLREMQFLGADLLSLEGGGGDFEKKNCCKRLSEEKNCMQHKCNRKLMGKKVKKISCPPGC